jgi:uncharacterized iron-regulated membrane protein
MSEEIKTETPGKLNLWMRWMEHPQRVWLRRALLQVHLWVGIAASVYLLVMSISGTILVFRVEIETAYLRQPVIVAGPGARLTDDELKEAIGRAYPNYEIRRISHQGPKYPVDVLLHREGKTLQRLFNPFTGADLGNSLRPEYLFTEWLVDLHDNLLYRPVGRFVNLAGGMSVTLICATGAVIWWPGIMRWRRSLTVRWKADLKSLNWALHSAFGFWSIAFVFMWGISGAYVAYPKPFEALVAFLDPTAPTSRKVSFGEAALVWLAKLHFGRFGGMTSKVIWAVFGVAPVLLVITGILIWWNTVLGPKLRRRMLAQEKLGEVEPQLQASSQIGA